MIVVKGSVVSWAQAPEEDLVMDVRSQKQIFYFFMKLKTVFMKTNQQVIEKDVTQKKNREATHDNKAFDMSTNL